jgi:hypothetical protein
MASTGTVVSNGNWSNSSSWSYGRVPSNNDTVIVPHGKKITVDINSPTYSNMMVQVFGILQFNNGQKLNFDCNSWVVLSGTGVLQGGTPGSKIDMCSNTEWRGPGPTNGPLVYGHSSLPINLLQFYATTKENKVELSWTTLTEANNQFFSVERTTDNEHFKTIFTVAASGNSTVLLNYTALDLAPEPGLNYYRLKQTDNNGKFCYSGFCKTEFNPSTHFSMQLYPNPANKIEDVRILLNETQGKEVLVVVRDCFGREAYSKVIIMENTGENIFAFDSSGKLEKGVYIVTGISDKYIHSKRLVIQ